MTLELSSRCVIAYLFFCFLGVAAAITYAQASDNPIYLKYEKSLLSVSVEQVDIKRILLKLARESGIPVIFSKKLNRKVSAELSDAPLNEALPKLLKGINHAIVYSDNLEEGSVISKIFVFEKSKRTFSSRVTRTRLRRITNQVKNYEKRIQILKNKLTRFQGNNRIRQRYLNQIKSYERRIERLNRQR